MDAVQSLMVSAEYISRKDIVQEEYVSPYILFTSIKRLLASQSLTSAGTPFSPLEISPEVSRNICNCISKKKKTGECADNHCLRFLFFFLCFSAFHTGVFYPFNRTGNPIHK
jgi:hypothetical protein